MTRRTNARLAGFAFLLYIAVGITAMILFREASSGDTASRLASIARHAPRVPLEVVASLLMSVSAVTLGITLHALTRDVDRELAMFGMAFRIMEGMVGATGPIFTIVLLSLATNGAAANDHALAQLLFRTEETAQMLAATLFAFGSLAFTWLLLRGQLIPRALAVLGVLASVILVICLPLQLAGLQRGPFAMAVWVPMAVFEIPLGIWLIVKGVVPRS